MSEASVSALGMTTGVSTRLTAEDRLDIQDLFAHYSKYEDNGDAEAWGNLFTADGQFVGGGDKLIIGRDALIKFARDRWNDKPQVRNWTHWVANLIIRPTADGAEAESYQMVCESKDGVERLVKNSSKYDKMRKEDGVWKFSERRTGSLPLK